MPGVQSVQPDAGSLFRRTIHNATRLPVKRHRGSRDTHGTHKRTRGHTDHTDEPHNHPNPTTHPHDHATAETRNRGRLNSSKNSRRPGADHSPRPTQKRPPPANPTTCLHPQPVCVCVQNTVPCAVLCTVHPARLPVPTGNLHEARAETPSAPSQGCSHQKASLSSYFWIVAPRVWPRGVWHTVAY